MIVFDITFGCETLWILIFLIERLWFVKFNFVLFSFHMPNYAFPTGTGTGTGTCKCLVMSFVVFFYTDSIHSVQIRWQIKNEIQNRPKLNNKPSHQNEKNNRSNEKWLSQKQIAQFVRKWSLWRHWNATYTTNTATSRRSFRVTVAHIRPTEWSSC